MPIPRFLFDVTSDKPRTFVVHTHEPRFIGEVLYNSENNPYPNNFMINLETDGSLRVVVPHPIDAMKDHSGELCQALNAAIRAHTSGQF